MTKLTRCWICGICGKSFRPEELGTLEHMKEAHVLLFKTYPNPLVPKDNIIDVVVE
jgi:hypothetical protein